MYCKYCGKEVKQDAKFCPYCSRELTQQKQNSGTAFYLLLAVTLLPTAISTLRSIGQPYSSSVQIIFSLVIAAIGAAALLLLCQAGKINPSRFRGVDTLIWMLWLFLPSLTNIAGSYFAYWCGQTDAIGSNLLLTADVIFGQLGGLWIWLELIVLCMVRSGTLKVTVKNGVLVLGLLVIWSAALFMCREWIGRQMTGGIDELLPYFMEGVSLYFFLLWLRRGVELGFVALYGADQLSPTIGVLMPVILNGLTILLMPVFLFTLHLGIRGLVMSRLAAYFLSGSALFLLRQKSSKQIKQ